MVKEVKKILQQIKLSSILKITDFTFFVYSTHNNRRNVIEKNDILIVIERFLKLLLHYDADYCYKIIGDTLTLPPNIQFLCKQLLHRSNLKACVVINLAINYSAKLEIIQASERLVNQHLMDSRVTELTLDDFMYTSCAAAPDLIIRTSGQKRLSDFYLWQAVDSTLFFTDQCWPEFSLWTLMEAIFCHQFYRKQKWRVN